MKFTNICGHNGHICRVKSRRHDIDSYCSKIYGISECDSTGFPQFHSEFGGKTVCNVYANTVTYRKLSSLKRYTVLLLEVKHNTISQPRISPKTIK